MTIAQVAERRFVAPDIRIQSPFVTPIGVNAPPTKRGGVAGSNPAAGLRDRIAQSGRALPAILKCGFVFGNGNLLRLQRGDESSTLSACTIFSCASVVTVIRCELNYETDNQTRRTYRHQADVGVRVLGGLASSAISTRPLPQRKGFLFKIFDNRRVVITGW